MTEAMIAPTRVLYLFTRKDIEFWNLMAGFNQASIPGLPVLSKFQSNLVKFIFLAIGFFGGAAKLNQTVFNFTEPLK
jgi:hypothetical protein